MKNTKPPDENFTVRCPRLGHQISFSFCGTESQGLPCFKALDCWFDHFLVEEYLRAELRPEEWERAFERPPKPKMLSLLELIEEAAKRTEETS